MTHQVYLGDTGTSFPVAPGQSLLEAGLAAGVPLPYGCTSGTCAACRCRLHSGEVHYRAERHALSEGERAAGYTLLCQAEAASDIHLDWRAPALAAELRPAAWPCRLLDRQWLSRDVLGVWLKLPRGDAPFRFLPGQYVDFLLEDGSRRSFSLAAAPNDATLELHVKVTPDGRFGRYVANDLPARAMLRFEGPLGAFYLHESTRPALFIAGGTGFSPIKAILEEVLAHEATRAMHLYWGARTPDDLYMDTLAQQWAETSPAFRYTPVCSEAPAAEWSGARGLVHEQLLRDYPDLSGYSLYISGPPMMVASAKRDALAAGLDPDHLHYDSFEDAHITWPESP